MSKDPQTTDLDELTDINTARKLAKEYFEKSEKLQRCLDALAELSFTKEFASGWLSPTCRYKLKLSGKYGYKEISALIEKLLVDKETYQDIEFTQPQEKSE